MCCLCLLLQQTIFLFFVFYFCNTQAKETREGTERIEDVMVELELGKGKTKKKDRGGGEKKNKVFGEESE